MIDDPLNVKKRAELVGYICTQYSYFDYLISNVIWSQLSIEKDVGVMITGPMDIRPKIELAISLLDHYENSEKLRALLQRFKNNASSENGFISKRNKIIHGIMSSSDGLLTVMIELHRKKSQRERHEISLEYIQQCHDEILAANDELKNLMQPEGINID
ncbi:hypothetical protein [Endozoicomonas sp. ALC020]|uniref:hypothetical protein n=1 Tax=unclassified Endozoicomonas TaxID=2644528 RepID=UPI003BAF3C87